MPTIEATLRLVKATSKRNLEGHPLPGLNFLPQATLRALPSYFEATLVESRATPSYRVICCKLPRAVRPAAPVARPRGIQPVSTLVSRVPSTSMDALDTGGGRRRRRNRGPSSNALRVHHLSRAVARIVLATSHDASSYLEATYAFCQATTSYLLTNAKLPLYKRTGSLGCSQATSTNVIATIYREHKR